MKRYLQNSRGLTLIELVVTMVILSILASMVIPTSQLAGKRLKEMELRRNLRVIRTAIDDYQTAYEKAVAQNRIPRVENKTSCPETLKTLVEGYDFGGLYNYKKKFLRRIPIDPFHPESDPEKRWGLRSYKDEPDSTNWGGEDVYDVYSLSEGTAIDGTKYKDW